jgi:hypothetical protein
MPLNLPPSRRKDWLRFVLPMSSSTYGGAKTRTDWRICTKRSGILTSSSPKKKNNQRRMLTYKMKAMIKISTYGFIFFIFFGKIHAQVLIDTNTIKQANTYLVKGAIAREQVTHLRKIVTSDSIIIAEQDSIIVKVRINNAHLREKNKALVSENKAIITTLKLYNGISIGLAILTLVGWLR